MGGRCRVRRGNGEVDQTRDQGDAMKIRMTLKDPDTMPDAVCDAVHADVKTSVSGVSDAERKAIANERQCEIQGEISSRWMLYGEYLEVEFDTDDWTATVLPRRVDL